ncbi:MAG: hypothetical protein ACI9GW_002984, partial [Halieaceae bacterium]
YHSLGGIDINNSGCRSLNGSGKTYLSRIETSATGSNGVGIVSVQNNISRQQARHDRPNRKSNYFSHEITATGSDIGTIARRR